jgi:hypothetical protein
MNTKTPGNRTWIINTAIPGPVIIAGTVNDYATINIAISVAWQITDINNLRCCIININVLHIINR